MSQFLDISPIARKSATLTCAFLLAAGTAACGSNGAGPAAPVQPAGDLDHVAGSTTPHECTDEPPCPPGMSCAR